MDLPGPSLHSSPRSVHLVHSGSALLFPFTVLCSARTFSALWWLARSKKGASILLTHFFAASSALCLFASAAALHAVSSALRTSSALHAASSSAAFCAASASAFFRSSSAFFSFTRRRCLRYFAPQSSSSSSAHSMRRSLGQVLMSLMLDMMVWDEGAQTGHPGLYTPLRQSTNIQTSIFQLHIVPR